MTVHMRLTFLPFSTALSSGLAMTRGYADGRLSSSRILSEAEATASSPFPLSATPEKEEWRKRRRGKNGGGRMMEEDEDRTKMQRKTSEI